MWNCPMQILKAFMIVRKSYSCYPQKLKDWIHCSSLVEKIIKYLLLLSQNINKELHLSQGFRTLKKLKKIFLLVKIWWCVCTIRTPLDPPLYRITKLIAWRNTLWKVDKTLISRCIFVEANNIFSLTFTKSK